MSHTGDHLDQSLKDVMFAARAARHRPDVTLRIIQTIQVLANIAKEASCNLLGSDADEHDPILLQRNTKLVEYLVLGPVDGQIAEKLYKERRIRDELFGDPNLFGEPAWDILLDLLQAEVDRRPISVTSACIGASVPPTTALRWISYLVEKGLVDRTDDDRDRRRAFVRLSKKGLTTMQIYLTKISKGR